LRRLVDDAFPSHDLSRRTLAGRTCDSCDRTLTSAISMNIGRPHTSEPVKKCGNPIPILPNPNLLPNPEIPSLASSRCEKSLRMSSLAEFFTKNAKGKTQLSRPFFYRFSARKFAKTPRNARFLGADHIGRETNLFSRRERTFSYSRFPANVPNLLGCNSVSVAWEHCGFANIFSVGDLHCQPFKSYRPS
jgi:hypothetical protein